MEPLRHSSGLGRLAWQVVGGDDARRIADIVQVCNLVDEQLESLEFEYKEIDTILGGDSELCGFEGFDPPSSTTSAKCAVGTVSNEFKLPVEAGAACHVFRTLREEREYEVRDLEAIALRDPVLAGNLLAWPTRRSMAAADRVSTVGRAIASVGVIAARKIMLAAAMRPMFASAGLKRIWSHSLSSAPLCAALAGHTGLLTAEEGLVLGLVHDIGAVAIQFLPRETLATYRNLLDGGCPAAYVEHLLLGRDHGEIGAGLIAGWNFPESSSKPCASIISPSASASNLPSLAYLAEFWSGLDEDLLRSDASMPSTASPAMSRRFHPGTPLLPESAAVGICRSPFRARAHRPSALRTRFCPARHHVDLQRRVRRPAPA